MPDLTFIVSGHPARTGNLCQCLRLLAAHEPDLIGRVVVAWNGDVAPEFPVRVRVACSVGPFSKPRMMNAAVRASGGGRDQLLALLDGDRILPAGYFRRAVAAWRPRSVVSTVQLFANQRAATDDEIEAGTVPREGDYRSTDNLPFSKVAFAGNAVIGLDDYWDLGGMDETFEGYGFSDTDFTQSAVAAGFRFIWMEEPETHLWHPRDIPAADYNASNERNGLRYLRKWGLRTDRHPSERFRLLATDPRQVPHL